MCSDYVHTPAEDLKLQICTEQLLPNMPMKTLSWTLLLHLICALRTSAGKHLTCPSSRGIQTQVVVGLDGKTLLGKKMIFCKVLGLTAFGVYLNSESTEVKSLPKTVLKKS